MTEMLLVFTTFANEDDAARVARTLLEERRIACASLLGGADEREVVVLMKTRAQDWPTLSARLHELHPYEVPECVAVRPEAVAPKYLAWLEGAMATGGAGEA